eukprot:4080657-Prymnesium_polylepis.1
MRATSHSPTVGLRSSATATLKAGHLWLEEGTVTRTFKRREFELDDDILRYREGQLGRGPWLADFQLAGATIVLTKKARQNLPFSFRINLSDSARKVVLAAESEEERI